jgi:hypothetical protein
MRSDTYRAPVLETAPMSAPRTGLRALTVTAISLPR